MICRVVSLLLLCFFLFYGCAHVTKAIEYSDMRLALKMSDTIFLDPVLKAKNRKVYVHVSNTSDMQEVNPLVLQSLISSRLTAKGYEVVNDPETAGYLVQTNILYMDYYRETGTHEGAVAGALTGGTLGVLAGNSRDTMIALGMIGGLVGGLGGALIGKTIKVETYAGVVDVEIRERAAEPVVGQITTEAKQGTSTTVRTQQQVKTSWQIYRTKIACVAQQTNINKQEAARKITDRIAAQIAGMF
jgi:hypothetical protein